VLKNKFGKCEGKPKTNLQYSVLSKTDHSCIPNIAEVEVKVKLGNCGKRARKDAPVPVPSVYKEELSLVRKVMA
jgi:hypothetical protein